VHEDGEPPVIVALNQNKYSAKFGI
jgi:hypothetical protein